VQSVRDTTFRRAVRSAARSARAKNDCEDARSTGARRATPRLESCRESARARRGQEAATAPVYAS
jgi:hypothetical protein